MTYDENMTVEDFLLRRLDDMEAIGGYFMYGNNLVQMMREAVEWHKNWPVLVETEPKFTAEYDTSVGNSFAVRYQHQMAWVTQQEYIKRFGSQPPTAPLLRKWANVWSRDPEFHEEWRL